LIQLQDSSGRVRKPAVFKGLHGQEAKEELSDEEAERRATEGLRRALTTPYRPQREMLGKVGRKKQREVKRGAKQKTDVTGGGNGLGH
jgi:hypothetical protein